MRARCTGIKVIADGGAITKAAEVAFSVSEIFIYVV